MARQITLTEARAQDLHAAEDRLTAVLADPNATEAQRFAAQADLDNAHDRLIAALGAQ